RGFGSSSAAASQASPSALASRWARDPSGHLRFRPSTGDVHSLWTIALRSFPVAVPHLAGGTQWFAAVPVPPSCRRRAVRRKLLGLLSGPVRQRPPRHVVRYGGGQNEREPEPVRRIGAGVLQPPGVGLGIVVADSADELNGDGG